MNFPATVALSAALACTTMQASAETLASSRRSITYHSVDIQGLKIFYREAGPADALTVILLHGFPSSSRMWEPLLPARGQVSPDRAGLSRFRQQQRTDAVGFQLYI